DPQQENPQPVAESHEARVEKTAAEKEPATQADAGPRGPVPVSSAPAARAANVTPEVQPQKASLPAKKVWSSNSAATAAERPRTDAPRPEPANKPAPKATVAVQPAEAPDAPEGEELFATFGSGVAEQEAPKSKSFITSKAGMGVIGGAIAAAALT